MRWVSASKRADRLQAVAEEIEPHRLIEPGRKQIEDAAAHGVFAGFAHGGRAVVAVVLQPRHDGVHRHDMAGRDRQRLRRDDFARRHPLHDGVDRGQHDQRLVAAGQPRQPRQRGQPLRQDAAMRRHPVIGLAVPGRKLHHRQIRREEFQRAGQLLHPRTVAADHGEADRRRFRPRRHRAREVRDHQTFRALGDIGKGQRAAGRQQFGRRSCRLTSCVVIHGAKRLDALEQAVRIFRRRRRVAGQRGIEIGIGHLDQAFELSQFVVGRGLRSRRRQTGRE